MSSRDIDSSESSQLPLGEAPPPSPDLHNERLLGLQQELLRVQERVLQEVIVPSCRFLSRVDPSARVAISEKAGDSDQPLREMSDIDLMVLSEIATSPEHYRAYLESMNKLANDLYVRSKLEGQEIVPVFFTQEANETAIISRAHAKYPDARIVPVHFLFHRDYKAFLKQEEHVIDGLLESTNSILAPDFPKWEGKQSERNCTFEKIDFEGVSPDESKWYTQLISKGEYESYRRGTLQGHYEEKGIVEWDVERAIADFLLNEALLGGPEHIYTFVDRVWRTLRANSEEIFSDFSCEMHDFLRLADPDGERNLVENFSHMEMMRFGSFSDETLERTAPLEFTLELFRWFAERRAIHLYGGSDKGDKPSAKRAGHRVKSRSDMLNNAEASSGEADLVWLDQSDSLVQTDLKEILQNSDPIVRRTVARKIATTEGEVPSEIRLLEDLLNDTDVVTRAWAAVAVSRMGDSCLEIIPAVAQHLADPSPIVRWWCGRALGGMNLIEDKPYGSPLNGVLLTVCRGIMYSTDRDVFQLTPDQLDWSFREPVYRMHMRYPRYATDDQPARAALEILKERKNDTEASQILVGMIDNFGDNWDIYDRRLSIAIESVQYTDLVLDSLRLWLQEYMDNPGLGQHHRAKVALSTLSELGVKAESFTPLLEQMFIDKDDSLFPLVSHTICCVAPELGLGEKLEEGKRKSIKYDFPYPG